MRRRLLSITGGIIGTSALPLRSVDSSSTSTEFKNGWNQFGSNSRNTGYRSNISVSKDGLSHSKINTIRSNGNVTEYIFDETESTRHRHMQVTDSKILYTGPLRYEETGSGLERNDVKITAPLLALDRQSGELLWEFSESDGYPIESGIAVSGNTVVVAGSHNESGLSNPGPDGGNIYGVDIESGDKLWKVSFDGRPEDEIAIYDDIAYVAATHYNSGLNLSGEMSSSDYNQIIAVNIKNGQVIWELTDKDVFSIYAEKTAISEQLNPAADSSGVYLTTGSDSLVRITHNGKINWERDIGPDYRGLLSPPVLDEENVYTVSEIAASNRATPSHQLSCYNKKTGKLNYTYELNSYPPSLKPMVTDNYVFVSESTGGVYQNAKTNLIKINKTTGEKVWITKIKGRATTPISGSDELLFVNTFRSNNQRLKPTPTNMKERKQQTENKLVAISQENGNIIYEDNLPYSPLTETMVLEDELYFLDLSNSVVHYSSDGSNDTSRVPVPQPNITIQSSVIEAESKIHLSVNNSNNVSVAGENMSISWGSDDTRMYNDSDPNAYIKPNQQGNHIVNVSVENKFGNVGTASKEINIQSEEPDLDDNEVTEGTDPDDNRVIKFISKGIRTVVRWIDSI